MKRTIFWKLSQAFSYKIATGTEKKIILILTFLKLKPDFAAGLFSKLTGAIFIYHGNFSQTCTELNQNPYPRFELMAKLQCLIKLSRALSYHGNSSQTCTELNQNPYPRFELMTQLQCLIFPPWYLEVPVTTRFWELTRANFPYQGQFSENCHKHFLEKLSRALFSKLSRTIFRYHGDFSQKYVPSYIKIHIRSSSPSHHWSV